MSHDGLKIDTVRFDEGMIVAPSGEIDLGRSGSLREAIAEASGHQPQRLVIDLAGVPYMDSSGVATLVEALQLAMRQKRALILCGLQPRVRSVFEIARLDTVFTIVADRAAAAAAGPEAPRPVPDP